MIIESDIYIEGERRLGWYTVELLRATSKGWELTTLPMHALISNYRLILKPLRKKYPPASIPRSLIRKVRRTVVGHHMCVDVQLKEGAHLYMVLSSGNLDDMVVNLETMTTPPRFRFDETIPQQNIERLIRYFTEGIPPNEA